MTEEELKALKYPVGEFSFPDNVSEEDIGEWKDIIAGFPEMLEETLSTVTYTELGWKYRPDGWTVQQVVHHLADSHLNSIIRFKLALTEEEPTIKPYFEARWAELADANNPYIEFSMDILRGIHQRWTMILDDIQDEQWARTYIHPEHGRKLRLDQTLALYAWHCNHHLAHINQALDKGGY